MKNLSLKVALNNVNTFLTKLHKTLEKLGAGASYAIHR